MIPTALRCYAFTTGAACALLAGCNGLPSPTGAQGATAASRGYSRVTSNADGFGPSSRLVPITDVLYGTTAAGGANNQGTVYRITTSGAENVVYSFAVGCRKRRKCADGLNPTSLVGLNGTLYGTTGGGGVGRCFNSYGPDGCGTFFSVTTSGDETVLYSFTGGGCGNPLRCPGANYPNGLTAIHDNHGTLYGASWYGGRYAQGTVFSVTTSGVERVLHSFGKGCNEICGYPDGRFVDLSGTLYGTDPLGGEQNAGDVFSMSATGRTNVLYSFDAPQHGGNAGVNDGLLNVSGTLYGTSRAGGAYQKGTAFSITPNGTLIVVHSFGAGCHPGKRCSDGEYPDGSLIDVKGKLYGTTAGGGLHASGTVFSLTTSGSENVLHSFANSEGSPAGELTRVKGLLYGTTAGGECDGGEVYSITLAGTTKVLHVFC